MSSNSNKKKSAQLGISHGTASNRLRKAIMFSLIKETGKDMCFHCEEKIESIDNLSIEHKVPWLDSEDPVGLYFDLDNIAFSHLSCNSGNRRSNFSEHGTTRRYGHYGCRCDLCTQANTEKTRRFRNK